MGKVTMGLSMSLDGFIAGPNDGPERPLGDGGERLFEWYSGGHTEYRLPATEMVFMLSPQSAELLGEAHTKMGTFDIANGWGGNPPCAYRPSSSPISSLNNGFTKDLLSRSSRRGSRALSSKRERLQGTRT